MSILSVGIKIGDSNTPPMWKNVGFFSHKIHFYRVFLSLLSTIFDVNIVHVDVEKIRDLFL